MHRPTQPHGFRNQPPKYLPSCHGARLLRKYLAVQIVAGFAPSAASALFCLLFGLIKKAHCIRVTVIVCISIFVDASSPALVALVSVPLLLTRSPAVSNFVLAFAAAATAAAFEYTTTPTKPIRLAAPPTLDDETGSRSDV